MSNVKNIMNLGKNLTRGLVGTITIPNAALHIANNKRNKIILIKSECNSKTLV